MATENTAIVLVDPYNDFLHQDGKLNQMIRDSLDKTNTIANLHKLLAVARNKKIPIFYCLHQQSHAHSMQGWNMMNAALEGTKTHKVFEEGSWGAEFYDGMAPDAASGDVIVSKHWNSRYARATPARRLYVTVTTFD
jgi:nicotinamidase-related amidase